jgi:hypothetical protein
MIARVSVSPLFRCMENLDALGQRSFMCRRNAVRPQKVPGAGMAADGYPDLTLVEALRGREQDEA